MNCIVLSFNSLQNRLQVLFCGLLDHERSTQYIKHVPVAAIVNSGLFCLRMSSIYVNQPSLLIDLVYWMTF